MKRFDITKWKNEIKASIPVLEQRLAQAEAARADAWILYKTLGYCDEEWEKFRSAEKEEEAIKAELKKARILSQAAFYCNRYYHTDIEPYEVIEFVNEKTLVVRKMKADLTEEARKALRDSFSAGGFFGHTDNSKQVWEIVPDEQGEVYKVRLHKDGCYHIAGDKGTKFRLAAKPVKFYDYNF